MFLIFVFFQKHILDLLIKQGNEKYMNQKIQIYQN